MLGTISQQMLDRINLLQSGFYKSAAAVSDAAAVTGGDVMPEGAQPAPEEAPSLADELRARAQGADPSEQAAMLEAAQRLEMVSTVNAPAQATQEQPAQEQPAQEAQEQELAQEQPQEQAPQPVNPEAKMASHREGRDLTRFAVPLDDKTKQAAILADSGDRAPTMDGFRSWLSQFS